MMSLNVAIPDENFSRSAASSCSCSVRVFTAAECRARACRIALMRAEMSTTMAFDVPLRRNLRLPELQLVDPVISLRRPVSERSRKRDAA